MRVDGDTAGRTSATSPVSGMPPAFSSSGTQGLEIGVPQSATARLPGASNDNATCLPSRQPYIGVILRQVRHAGIGCFEIILAHPQPNLSRLYASHPTDETVIAEWRRIGESLRLPLLILNGAGSLEAVADFATNLGVPRRRGSPLSGRRPRFLARRRSGNLSILGIVHRNDASEQ
jgi:hypothetical protein